MRLPSTLLVLLLLTTGCGGAASQLIGGSERGEAGAVIVVHAGSTARAPMRISRRRRVA
jgi:hypothetical protein